MIRDLKKLYAVAAFGILAMGASSQVQAQVMFSNLGGGNSYQVDDGNLVGSTFANANSFTTAFTGNVTSISLALSSFFGTNDPVTIQLRSDASGPGAALETWTLGANTLGLFGNTNPLVLFVSAVHPLLTAGTTYWVSAVGGPNDLIAWNLNNTGDSHTTAFSENSGASYTTVSQTPGALLVNGTPVSGVPEPGTVVLVATGLAGVFGFARRKHKQLVA